MAVFVARILHIGFQRRAKTPAEKDGERRSFARTRRQIRCQIRRTGQTAIAIGKLSWRNRGRRKMHPRFKSPTAPIWRVGLRSPPQSALRPVPCDPGGSVRRPKNPPFTSIASLKERVTGKERRRWLLGQIPYSNSRLAPSGPSHPTQDSSEIRTINPVRPASPGPRIVHPG